MVWRDGAPLLCISNISHIYEHSTTITHAPPSAVLLLHIIITTTTIIIIAIHASQISVVSSGSRCISPKEYTMGMSYGRLGGRSSSVLRCEHAIILLRLSMLCSSINHNSTSNIRRRCISLWRRRCIFRNLEVRRSAA